MLDLHCHILPGVDDGAADLDAAIAMARALRSAGFSGVAASPHVGEGPGGDVSPHAAATARSALVNRLKSEGIDLEILPNGEHFLSPLLFERLTRGEISSVGGQGRWIMVELPWQPLVKPEEILFRLQSKGYKLLLAHAERYPFVDKALVKRLVERGVKVQLELGSFVNLYGQDANFKALTLADAGLAHILATDMHDATDADVWLPAALRAVSSRYGRRAVKAGAADAPRLLVDDAAPDDVPSFAVGR